MGRISQYAGMRVEVRSGPREGAAGEVLRAVSNDKFRVRFDDGSTHLVLRSIARVISRPATAMRRRGTRSRHGSVPERVARILGADPSAKQVVVYRTQSGRIWTLPWHGQSIEGDLVGIYDHQAVPERVLEDVAATEPAAPQRRSA